MIVYHLVNNQEYYKYWLQSTAYYMEKPHLIINPSIIVKVSASDPYKVQLIDSLCITPLIRSKVLVPYLASLFESLALRTAKPMAGVPKYVLNEYLALPGLIGERMFSLFDADRDGFLKKKEFQDGLSRLFTSSHEEKLKLVYDLFDFDSDGLVSKEDIRTLLSHVPLAHMMEPAEETTGESPEEGRYTKNGGGNYFFLDRLQTQAELVKLIERCLGDKELISLHEFAELTEKGSSTIFLCLLLLLRRSCAVYNDFAQYCLSQNIKNPEDKSESSPSASQTKLLPSPELEPLKMLSPFAQIKKMSPLLKSSAESRSVLRNLSGKHREESKSVLQQKVITVPREEQKEINKVKEETPSKIIKEGAQTKRRSIKSGAPFIDKTSLADMAFSPVASTEGVRAPVKETPKDQDPPRRKSLAMCACGNECKDPSELRSHTCKICMEKLKANALSGYLYEKANTRTLNRHWYSLVGTHLYRYTNRTDTEHKGMFSLVGCFIREEPAELVQEKVPLFPFKLIFGTNQMLLYTIRKEEYTRWMRALKQAIGYTDLADFYDIKEPLGRGKFGVVRAAIHKASGTRVAVKIIKKSKLSIEDLDLTRREIEILKLCQHPCIIRLLDTFENPDYIYIVMELLQGGDMYEYLNKRDFRVSEDRARTLVHSLATALYYLHSYGIVHRDIKLDNVLMVDNSESSGLKLVDFGLSKMIGPNETCTEPFGTFGYAAPEVLQGKPYDKGVDIWSLGVCMYIMLVGHAPFEEEEEEKLAQETIAKEPDYDGPEWNLVSKEAKACVRKMLSKDRTKRMTLKELLTNPWLTSGSESLKQMRENATFESAFRMNALQSPMDLAGLVAKQFLVYMSQ